MHITMLNLSNFRNYFTLMFEPQNGLNILVGKNAQGKSAVLEAIYFLATSKSNRTSRDQDLIHINHDYLRVEASVSRVQQNNFFLEIAMDRIGHKIAKVDESKQPRVTDLLGKLNVVVFSSADIEMVRGEPSSRRRFMNLDISQSNPRYAYALSGYKKVLMQRNNLLKEIKNGNSSASELPIWNSQLAAFGAAVIVRRRSFLEELGIQASRVYSELTGDSENLVIKYQSNPDVPPEYQEQQIADLFLQKIQSRTELDIIRGTTTCGPQRDDFTIEIANMAARDFASQGQQRSAAIAIRLAQMRVFEELAGEPPVILLDDVLAELDIDRRYALTSMLFGKCQTLITTTNTAEIPAEILEQSSVFVVSAGTISQGT